MKKNKIGVLVLCIIFLVVMVYSSQETKQMKKDHYKLKSHKNTHAIIASILGQVHEYQHKMLMYRKMYFANDRAVRIHKKLEGFMDKLDKGNNLKYENGKGTIEELITKLTSNPDIEYSFKIKDICLTFHNIDAKASGYTIDCTAKVKMGLMDGPSPTKNSDVDIEVDHMKNCEPD